MLALLFGLANLKFKLVARILSTDCDKNRIAIIFSIANWTCYGIYPMYIKNMGKKLFWNRLQNNLPRKLRLTNAAVLLPHQLLRPPSNITVVVASSCCSCFLTVAATDVCLQAVPPPLYRKREKRRRGRSGGRKLTGFESFIRYSILLPTGYNYCRAKLDSQTFSQ